ncbi:hypothetical protein ES695_11485 [Candidatus Atribacteria bacterium 1244-E10-H5-B2]|nr:MAG: hypothetical protein ES695_11485 [Candidatus Atribacteria bacterium 1244-E10-H5-B2]
MIVNLKNLEETRAFYKLELKKKDLTERERDKYSKALKLIERFISGKEKSGETKKDYYVENQDEIKKYQGEYRIKNRDKIRKHNKQYRNKKLGKNKGGSHGERAS